MQQDGNSVTRCVSDKAAAVADETALHPIVRALHDLLKAYDVRLYRQNFGQNAVPALTELRSRLTIVAVREDVVRHNPVAAARFHPGSAHKRVLWNGLGRTGHRKLR